MKVQGLGFGSVGFVELNGLGTRDTQKDTVEHWDQGLGVKCFGKLTEAWCLGSTLAGSL